MSKTKTPYDKYSLSAKQNSHNTAARKSADTNSNSRNIEYTRSNTNHSQFHAARPTSIGSSQHFTPYDLGINGSSAPLSPYQAMKNKGVSTPYENYSSSAMQNSHNTAARKSEDTNSNSRNIEYIHSNTKHSQSQAARPTSIGSSQHFTPYDSSSNSSSAPLSPYQAIKNKGASTPYENYSSSAMQNSHNTAARKSADTNSNSRNIEYNHSNTKHSQSQAARPTSSGSSQHFTPYDSSSNSSSAPHSPYPAMKDKGATTPYGNYSSSAKNSSADKVQHSHNATPRQSDNANRQSGRSEFIRSNAKHSQFHAARPTSIGSSQHFTPYDSGKNGSSAPNSPYQTMKNRGASTPYENYSSAAKQNFHNTAPEKSDNTNRQSGHSEFTRSNANYSQFHAARPTSSGSSQHFTPYNSGKNGSPVPHPPYQAMKNKGTSTPYKSYSNSTKHNFADKVQHSHNTAPRQSAGTNSQSRNSKTIYSNTNNPQFRTARENSGGNTQHFTRYSRESPVNPAASKITTNTKTEKFKPIRSAFHKAAFAVGVFSPFRQTQFHLNRIQTEDGKFKTKVSIVNSKDFRYTTTGEFQGVLHTVHNLAKTKIQGDVPSVTKALNAVKPTTAKGKAALTAAKGSWKLVKFSKNAAVDSALAAETAAVVVSKRIVGAYTGKLREELSKQGTGKVILAAGSAGKFLISHMQKRRIFLAEKRKYKQKKATYKRQKKSINHKRTLEKIQLKKEKTTYLTKKDALKHSKSPIKKHMIKRNKEKFKATKKKIKKYRKTAKKLKNSYKRQKISQGIVKGLNRQFQLPVEIALAGVKAPLKSVKDKILTADAENDTLTAVNKGIQAAGKANRAVKSVTNRIARYSADNFRTISKRQESLNNQSKKLREKSKPKKKKYRKKKNQSFKDYVKESVNRTLESAKTMFRGMFKQVMLILLPIVAVAVLVVGAVVLLESFLPSTGFVLGTYTADDEQLSDAVESYTLIARNFNQAIDGIDDNSVFKNWKTSLKTLGVNTNDYKTKPANFVYGRSSTFDYEPADYDFDPYILWSFLCAYNYDFDKSAECRENGKVYSPEYWEMDSATEDLLVELFYKEYSFEHYYTDSSHWEELSDYNVLPNNEGGRTGTYYTIYYDFSHSAFRYRKAPSEIKKFAKDGWIHYNENTLEILNANDNDKRTGWFLQDQRETIDNRISFYSIDQYGQYYCYGTNRVRTPCSWSDGREIWFCVSPWDSYDFNDSFPDPDQVGDEEKVCLVSFYQKNKWVNSAQLFYNVKKKCTFIEAAESLLNSMSYPSDRLQYFHLLVGDDTACYHGNHQCMQSPVNTNMQELIDSGRIYNSFGFDISDWNTTHCDIGYNMHNGLDITCDVGENVCSMISGEVTDVSNNSVTVFAKDFELVYSKNNKKSRKYDITVTIHNVSPCVAAGDTVTVGKIIGTATDARQCNNADNSKYSTTYIHISIGITRLFGNPPYIDPKLLIY